MEGESRGWHRLSYGLSRELWLVEVGIFLNTLGWGAVLPFEVIYLHDGRGFSLGVAGLVVGTITGGAVLVAPLTGPLIDRFGARVITVIAGVALAAGYAGLAFAHVPAQAFAAAAFAGAGNGALNPSQSTLLATLTPAGLRHRSTAVSRVATNAGMGAGGALGGLIAAYGLTGFVALFLANAVTYLLYVLILVCVVREQPRPEPVAGGYRIVLRDRAFLHLAAVNVATIAIGWGVFTWLLPPYARSEAGISAPLIGLLLLANAAGVVIAQVPITRFAEGRRRVVMVAVANSVFVCACLLVVGAGAVRAGGLAYALLVIADVAVAVGECFHTAAMMPLVADLAPPAVRGRYMAAAGFSWWIGLTLAPTVGAQLLSVSPEATFGVAAAVAAMAALSALRLDRKLPGAARRTPVTRPAVAASEPEPA